LQTNQVFSESLVVVAADNAAMFAALQSRPHELWARFFGSSLKDDPRYTPSDCFETFPFPKDWEHLASLEDAGRSYYDFRAQLMATNNEGLTDTYNRFNDPNERDAGVIRLRHLHAQMDCAMLEAYGWSDLQPTHKFLLDFEDEEDDDDARARGRKPWRYRWPDELHDEVLARLLKLNSRRSRGH
jgi:hypothetical protein